MKCSLLTLSCALDGELSRERQAELDTHLVTCERCRTGMRYLREETERISQLSALQLSGSVTSALLERARVHTTAGPPGAEAPARAPESPTKVPDPFDSMGLGAALLEEPTLPRRAVEETAPPPAEDQPASADDPPITWSSGLEAASADLVAPEGEISDVTAPADIEPLAGMDPATDASPPIGGEEAPIAEAEPEDVETAAPPIDAGWTEPGITEPDTAAPPEASWTAPEAGDTPSWEDVPAEPSDPEPSPWATEPLIPADPGPLYEPRPVASWPDLPPGEGDSGGPGPGDAGLAPDGTDVPAETTAFGEAESWVSGGSLETQETPTTSSAVSDRPLEDSASSEDRPDTVVVPGWEPATELKMPWTDIPAALPADEGLAPDLSGVPVERHGSMPPAAPFPAAPTTRPAEAAAAGQQLTDRGSSGRPVVERSSGGAGGSRPSRPPTRTPGTEPRRWTRTGIIAVAAAALVLILYNVLHGSGQPAAGHHHNAGQPTASASIKPSPSAQPTPRATPSPLALSGVQTIGSGGSGYQVDTVRYGVHGSQFWVVFQLVQGSGEPTVTTGFDGPQTLYIEMAGVSPGTSVPQPASGNLVTSVTIGHVSGFSGAVYVLHLSRAAQESPSFLAGNDSGGSGMRLVNILQ
ncbi:MAG: zf-HC2 domain-containing protein [Candidatus Dormibacteria bacterium]